MENKTYLNQCQMILGTSGMVSIKELDDRFKILANQCHPDKHTSENSDVAKEQFLEVKKAYEYMKCYLNDGDFTEFEKKYNDGATDCRQAAGRIYKKGIMLYKQGDINNSLEYFLKAQQCDDNNFDYERAILRCLMKKPRRVYEAKERCLTLIKRDMFFGENYYLMGKIYETAGLDGAAGKYYEKARELGFENMKKEISIPKKKKTFARLLGK